MKNFNFEYNLILLNRYVLSRCNKKLLCLALFYFLPSLGVIYSQSFNIVVPDIPGIKVTAGESVLIPAVESALAFQFGTTGSTNFIVETSPDTIQVYYEVSEDNDEVVYGTFFNIEKVD